MAWLSASSNGISNDCYCWGCTIPRMVKREQERPVGTQPDSWAKITVVLLDRHVAYLDRIAVDIRLQFGFAISRAELIRALIEAASQSGLVLSDAGNMKQMIAMIRDVWSGSKPRRKK